MVQVKSSMNRSETALVQVEIKGVAEAMRQIMEKGQMIVDGADARAFQAANFIQQEIQESIVGNRAEEKSVDTGNFANSINVEKVEDKTYSVFTEVEYSKFLEYGTSKMAPRGHFTNTVIREKQRAQDIIKGTITSV